MWWSPADFVSKVDKTYLFLNSDCYIVVNTLQQVGVSKSCEAILFNQLALII